MKTWGIIGLGWLGLELSKSLDKSSNCFWGTHTKDFNFLSDVFPDRPCDILFLNTPPLTSLTPKDFVEKILLSSNSKLIYVSSTSLFGGNNGKVTEYSIPAPTSKNGQWLFGVETLLLKTFSDRVQIVRPGGLIGGQKHPIKHLAGQAGIPNGNSAINLIHRKDLINIILQLSKTELPIPFLNAVAPAHPRKKDYYQGWADKLNLSRPLFEETMTESRSIDSEFLPSIYPEWFCPNLDFL